MSVYRRGKIWWVRFQAQGRRIRQSAKTTSRHVALQYERELREQYAHIARGGKPRRTYEEAMERFIVEHHQVLKPETARRYVSCAKALQPHLEPLYLDQIGRRVLSDMVAYWRREGKSRDTMRNNLACLSSMFACAIDWEWSETNPVQSFRKHTLGKPTRRTRYLTHAEERRVLDYASLYLEPMIAFAIDTGLRLEEQLSMTWDQVDLRRREIVIPRTKTDNPRTVPLLNRVATILAQQPRHFTSPYVWCKQDGSRYHKLTRGLAGAARRGCVENLRWHDLRRTCGCRLLQDHKMDIFKVSRWLGHKTVAVTERSYAFLRSDDLHEAVATFPATGAGIAKTGNGGNA